MMNNQLKMKMKRIYILDTTLRDGAQTSSVSFTVQDKLQIFDMLKTFGIDFIEAGWPGANDIDTEIFTKIKDHEKTAFCMTAKVQTNPCDDENLKFVSSVANIITIVGKSSRFHVENAIKTSVEKNFESIFSSIKFFKSQNKTVIFDAEHFFDGFKEDRNHAFECIEQATNAGAEFVTLCDTNGGTLPNEISDIVKYCVEEFPNTKFGIHTHNDCELAVANTIAAVLAGCQMVQGTINGLGERCGNASLTSVLPILILKLGYNCGKINKNIDKITLLSRKLSNILNEHHNIHMPFTGSSAFAHKGGLHASAVLKNPKLYEHIPPEFVGNKRKILISNQSGKSNVISMLNDVGLANFTDENATQITKILKEKTAKGYNFEGADASFYIIAKEIIEQKKEEFYKIISYKANVERRYNAYGKLETFSESIVKLQFSNDKTFFNASEGSGPVDAIYNAMNQILSKVYPQIEFLKLNDYKVRIIDSNLGTGAKILVVIEFLETKTLSTYSTVGVSQNIIDASFQALNDGVKYFLMTVN